MKNLLNIQELIDKKAENRLTKDLDNMRSTIFTIPILTGRHATDSSFPDMEFKGMKSKPYWFFNDGQGSFYKALYDFYLPIYKAEEAERFINEVNRLNENVNSLMNNETYD